MSASESEEQQPGPLTKAYRSVSPTYTWRENAEMGSVGWVLFLLLLALLLPLLPVVVVVWLVSKAFESVFGDR